MFEFRGAREVEREIAERGSQGVSAATERAIEQANREGSLAAAEAAARNQAAEQYAIIAAAEQAAMDSPQFRQAGYDAYAAQQQAAIDQLQRQIDQPRPALPTAIGLGLDAFGGYMRENMLGQLQDSLSRERFFADPGLVAPVYGRMGQVTGVRDEYGRLTGRDPIAEAQEEEQRRMDEAGQPEVVAPVVDMTTGQQECPEGYIFDADLNACRLAPRTRAEAVADTGEGFARMGLLDTAPEGLMGFQQRYGAGFGSPMDFEAANIAYRQGAATYPSFYRQPPKLTGYTLLS